MANRKARDHKYNTSPKGKVRRRRYDRKPEVQDTRRVRDLTRQRAKVLDELASVRKELSELE